MQQFRDASVATEDEVRGVLELHLQNRDLHPGVSTRDLAEAMRISEVEVEALLATVRARNLTQVDTTGELRRAKRRKRRDVTFASVVAALILIPSTYALYRVYKPTRIPYIISYKDYAIKVGDTTRIFTAPVEPYPAYQNHTLAPLLAQESEALLADIESKTPVPAEGRAVLIKQLEMQQPGPAFSPVTVEIAADEVSGEPVRVRLPIYSGTDPEVRAGVESVRVRRISDAMWQLSNRPRVE